MPVAKRQHADLTPVFIDAVVGEVRTKTHPSDLSTASLGRSLRKRMAAGHVAEGLQRVNNPKDPAFGNIRARTLAKHVDNERVDLGEYARRDDDLVCHALRFGRNLLSRRSRTSSGLIPSPASISASDRLIASRISGRSINS